jgi:uncharacterized protein YggE
MVCFSWVLIASAIQAEEPRRMSVQGIGQVSIVPDMATITVGVSAFEKQASRAMAVNASEMHKAPAALRSAGIADKDIQTQQLSLNPRWDNRSGSQDPKITGYTALNTVSIRVRVLEDLGNVIDSITKVGANRLHGVQFGIQKPRPHIDEARKRAIKDAQAKAELYAAAANVTIDGVILISEPTSDAQPRDMMRAEMAMAQSATPIAQGELTISSSINVVFALK